MSWYYLKAKSQNLRSSRELEEASLVEVCWGGEPWLQSKSKTIQGGFCYNGKLTDCYLDSLSGMTFAHSMDMNGEGKLQLSAEDSHAQTSVPQEKVLESKESNLPCGEVWRESYMKFSRNSATLRTHRSLFPEVLEMSSQIYAKWGMMQNGVLWERITLPLPTKEIVSGFWRTPECAKGGTVSMQVLDEMAGGNWKRKSGHMRQLRLQDQVRHEGLWPKYWLTPTCVNVEPTEERRESRREFRHSIGRNDSPGCLAEQVAVESFWPTPTCQETEHPNAVINKNGRRVSVDGNSDHSLNLADSVKTWPTPRSRDWKGCNSVEGLTRSDGKSRMDALPNAVAFPDYVTPRVGGEESFESVSKRKGEAAAGTHNTLSSVEKEHGKQEGQLSPDWTEWLMGWPVGWTRMEPLADYDCRDWLLDPAEDVEDPVARVGKGIADRNSRLKAIGNGQVPLCAAVAFKILISE